MKLLSPTIGLLLVGLLMPSYTVADISLKLKNQQYLPPARQDAFVNTQHKQHQQQTFHEDKYANSRYQIFEVHNHYEPPTGNEPTSQVNNGYLPPQPQELKIHVQHINAPVDFPVDDTNLDASYLNLASDIINDSQQIIVKHETEVIATNNKPSNSVSQPFHSNYQQQTPLSPKTREYLPPKENYKTSRKPIRSRQNVQSSTYQDQPQQFVNNFKGSYYFSPHNTQQQNRHISSYQQQTSQQIPTKSNSIVNLSNPKGNNHIQNSFKGPDYLPPLNGNNKKSSSNRPVYLPPNQSDSVQLQRTAFKGPDYLPPHKQNKQFKGPDYLPPKDDNYNQQQQTSFESTNPYKGPDYLPPHQSGHIQQNAATNYIPPQEGGSRQKQTPPLEQNTSFKASGYLPPQQPPQQHNYKGPDYLPPYEKQQQQAHYQNTNSNIKTLSYTPTDYDFQKPSNSEQAIAELHTLPEQGQQQQQSQYQNTNSNIKTLSYTPTDYDFQKPSHSEQAIAELHTLPEQAQQQYQQQDVTVGTQIQVTDQEKSNDIVYGSPKQTNNYQSVDPQQTSGYLPPGYDFRNPENEQTVNNQEHPRNSQRPAAEYLPSGYDFQKPENSEAAITQLHSQDSFALQQQSHVSNSVKGSEYLPPGYDFQKPENSEQAINQLHSLDAQVQQSSHSTGENINGQVYKAPSYLPPGYEFQRPDETEPTRNQVGVHQNSYQNSHIVEHHNQQLHGQQQQQSNEIHQNQHSQQNSFQTSHVVEQNHNQQLHGQNQQQSQSYNHAPVSQPAETHLNHHSLQKTYSGAQSQQFSQKNGQQSFKGPNYLPPITTADVSKQAVSQTSAQAFNGPEYLPPVQKPYSRAQSQQSNQKNGQQSFKGPNYLPPIATADVSKQTVSQTSAQAFNGPEYLPPVHTPQIETADSSSSQQINQPLAPEYKGPEYLPPINSNQVSSPQKYQIKASEYLPPTVATPSRPIEATNMYPLSSYMATVKPYERYGSARKPFPEYGPPPTTESTFFAQNDISSMYSDPASRPQYYAPTMSYEKNAIPSQTYNSFKQTGTSALNQQTRHTLQTLLPKNLRQQSIATRSSSSGSVATTALQTTKPASAKIRTVQIINRTAIRTLKVLESLDHAGVKTIKILGPSQEEPMGDHRVVKVVSGHGQSEQTVKIFNDQQDVTPSAEQLHNTSNNSYLPPRDKRSSNNKTKAKGRRRI